jgi:SAM-dependent methyltransferase
MEYQDVVRARGFGSVADLYDQARPTYPPALIADLLRGDPTDIVDVGCGTGKVGRLLLGAGRRVLGVEPDPRMAAVARRHGVEVEVSGWEAWEAGGRRYDLLVSGQAWHWVEPVAGVAKAAEVLRSGGRFAVFWNDMRHGPDVRAVFDRVYGRWAPDMLATSFALGVHAPSDGTDPAGEALAAGPFAGVVVGRRDEYHWHATYTPRAWADLVATHSDHLLLDPAVLAALQHDLVDGLAALGPSLDVPMCTDVLQAVRR